MRLLFVRDGLHLPDLIGGLERNTQALCKRLTASGVDTAVLAKLSHTGLASFAHRAARKLYKPAIGLADHMAGHATYRIWDFERDMDPVLAAFAPNVVVIQQGPFPEIIRPYLARGFTVVCYHHHVLWPSPAPQLTTDPALSHLSCSKFVADRLKADFGVPSHIVPPLIEPVAYRTRTSRREVLFVNPRPEKGADIAWALAKARPDITFRFAEAWMVTADEHRETTRRAALLGNVIVEQPRKDMRPLYARARLLLAPSQLPEAFGRTVAEAQLSGIPVLCSNNGGLPEAAGPGGIVLPANAPIPLWTDALAQLWDHSPTYQRLSDAALQHAARPDFAPARVADSFLGHMKNALHQARAARA